MDNKADQEMDKSLNDILAEVDKRFNKLEGDLGIHEIKYPVEIPTIDESKHVYTEEQKKAKEEAKRANPVLKEVTLDPIYIPPKDQEVEEEKKEETPKLDIPNFKPTKIPEYVDLKEKSVGEVVIPKNVETRTINPELKAKKKHLTTKVVAAVLALTAVTTMGLAKPHKDAVKSYQDNVDSVENFIALSGDNKIAETDIDEVGRDIGYAIAHEIEIHNIMKPDEKYDVNKAFVKYLTVSHDKIVPYISYSEKGAMGNGLGTSNKYWMVKIYNAAADSLAKDKILDLPEHFEDYLKANGFYDCKLSYNGITNKLSKDDAHDVSDVEALQNLCAYGNCLIGREENPEDKISEDFYNILEKVKDYFQGFVVSYDKMGIHIEDPNNKYKEVYESDNVDPLILHSSVNDETVDFTNVASEEEGVSHGRN